MAKSNLREAGVSDETKPLWTAPVIEVFDAKDAEAGNTTVAEATSS